MRKVLFATTALATVAGAMAVANADVTVSGGVEWRYVAVSDDVDNRTSDNSMVSNVDVTIAFSNTTDSGISTAASVNWDDGSAATVNSSVSADFGTIEWSEGSGSAHASSSYTVSSPGTSGGVGDMAHGVTNSDGDALGTSTVATLQANEAAIRDGENGVLNYHSPSFSGFSFGIGVSNLSSSDADTSTSFGVKYSGSAGDVSYSLGYGSYDGDGEDESSMMGGQVSWDGITVGAGSAENTDASGNEEETISYAVTYAMSDSLTIGVGMTDSENGTETLKNTQIGVAYTIAPGLTASLGSNSFEYDDGASASKDNEGTATQAELKMSF